MQKFLKTLFCAGALISTYPAHAGWKVGDAVLFTQCAANEVMDIQDVTGFYYSWDNPTYSE